MAELPAKRQRHSVEEPHEEDTLEGCSTLSGAPRPPSVLVPHFTNILAQFTQRPPKKHSEFMSYPYFAYIIAQEVDAKIAKWPDDDEHASPLCRDVAQIFEYILLYIANSKRRSEKIILCERPDLGDLLRKVEKLTSSLRSIKSNEFAAMYTLSSCLNYIRYNFEMSCCKLADLLAHLTPLLLDLVEYIERRCPVLN
eukprot:TRINITY_DN221_c0_g1_i12.p1 TRINITY_DN221_c0_g1~~TRINITY_DN221_c0_g1_i12.p1  ORF type:complete len:197 (-),score=30.06 TRINITY_DN221_c0_g1_i12:25-615(-)